MFDLNHHFVAAYADHFVATRLDAARRYRLGRPGAAAAIIGACAAVLRRLAAALDAWANASPPADLPEVILRERGSAN